MLYVPGNSTVRWRCSQLGVFFPVAQPASRHGNEYQRHRPCRNRKVQIAAEHTRSGKELNQGRAVKGVPGSMHQDGHEHAAPRVVEDPHDDETEADKGEGKHDEVEDSTSRRYIGKGLRWNQEPGQVPQRPETPQDEASNQRTMQPLQAGLGETAPSRFLEQRSSDEDHGPKHHTPRGTKRGNLHPVNAPPPPYEPAKPGANPRPTFGNRSHDEPG